MTEEIQIINSVLNGHVDSFRLLVERYQRPVIGIIAHIVNDPHTCEDIAQDVFFSAYLKLSTFDPTRSEFSTWLFTIARNKSLNVVKKKKSLPMDPLPEKADSSGCHLQQQELFERLDRALEHLPIEQKTAFVLAEFEKRTYEEIARIEDVRIGTVRSRIHRAREKLQAALDEFNGDET